MLFLAKYLQHFFEKVLPASGEGELQADGKLITLESLDTMAGRGHVALNIIDPHFTAFSEQLPGGGYGQSEIYSDTFTHAAIIRKILLSISSWMSYFFPFH